MQGKIQDVEQHFKRLATLCQACCEQYQDLEKALALRRTSTRK